jgi:transposase
MAREIDMDAIGSTTSRMSDRHGRVQVIARMSDRRAWTLKDKLAVLDEAFGAGGSVSKTAERHALGTGQIYVWRRLLLDGALGVPKPSAPAFARVEVASAPSLAALPKPVEAQQDRAPAEPSPPPARSLIPSGVRVRVNGGVDGKALKRVLDSLGAR